MQNQVARADEAADDEHRVEHDPGVRERAGDHDRYDALRGAEPEAVAGLGEVVRPARVAACLARDSEGMHMLWVLKRRDAWRRFQI